MNDNSISRRDFTRAAMVAVAAVSLPEKVLAQAEKITPSPTKPPAQQPQLSAEAQAEAERSYQAILARYGDRFTDEQKTDLHRLVLQQQKSLEALRAMPLENSDEPATVLRVAGGR